MPAGVPLRRVLREDRGSVTVEAALGIAVLVVVFGMIVAGLVTLAQYLAAVDAAGAAARAHAIGVELPAEPVRRVTVSVTEGGGLATATATTPTIVGELTATAVYPVEYR